MAAAATRGSRDLESPLLAEGSLQQEDQTLRCDWALRTSAPTTAAVAAAAAAALAAAAC